VRPSSSPGADGASCPRTPGDPHGTITGDVVITTGRGSTTVSGTSLLH
jgi:hypothetical protein